jgi:hypothetical protein
MRQTTFVELIFFALSDAMFMVPSIKWFGTRVKKERAH